MVGQHSTLELVRHDETARALERDNNAMAFELDSSQFAPEVTTIFVNGSLMEPADPGLRSFPLLLHRCSTTLRYLKPMGIPMSLKDVLPASDPRNLSSVDHGCG